MLRVRAYAATFKREIGVYQKAVRDPRCPRMARAFLGVAIAYALSPIDIIPDFIPVIGHLDDILVVPLLVWLGLRALPESLLGELRHSAGRTES